MGQNVLFVLTSLFFIIVLLLTSSLLLVIKLPYESLTLTPYMSIVCVARKVLFYKPTRMLCLPGYVGNFLHITYIGKCKYKTNTLLRESNWS